MIGEILYSTIINFLKILPVLIIAIVASQVIKVYLHEKKIKKSFKENEKNIAKASAIGIASPGPLIAYLPLLDKLKKKGLPISILVAFITGQTLIGPARLFLETAYFGFEFFFWHLVLSFFIAISIATAFMFLEKKIKF